MSRHRTFGKLGWPGHNSKLGYHCCILETFASSYEILPREAKYDALRNELKRGAMTVPLRPCPLSDNIGPGSPAVPQAAR